MKEIILTLNIILYKFTRYRREKVDGESSKLLVIRLYTLILSGECFFSDTSCLTVARTVVGLRVHSEISKRLSERCLERTAYQRSSALPTNVVAHCLPT